MTNAEAIEVLNPCTGYKKLIEIMNTARANYEDEEEARTEAQEEALNIAINALEKQIPFKPTPCNITLGRCKCGVGFLTKDTQFCGNCGQRLDWSVE